MAKRGSTRPHRVDFEWSNGVRGCETFGAAEDAARFIDQTARVATIRELSVTMTRSERVNGALVNRETVDISDAGNPTWWPGDAE